MDSGHVGENANPGTPSGDLLLLGRLTAELAPKNLGRSLDAAVNLLRTATGADDCEIFLREPEGGDLILAACCGPDRDALMEIVRFETGAGYPGLVAATGERILARHLDRDRRFLRHGVTRRGIVCFVSVPLQGTDGALGCIDFAWRDLRAPVERCAELLSVVARPIATAIQAGLLVAQDLVDRAVDDAGPEPAVRGKVCLDAIIQAAGARGGTLALYDADGGETTLFSTSEGTLICAAAADGRLRCRMVADGHGIALTSVRSTWPEACRCLPDATTSPLCLPLRSGRRLHGVVVLDRGEDPPIPPGRDLVPLLTMAHAAAVRLAPSRAGRPPADVVPGSVTPVLELRCFGSFDVLLHGQPVPPEAFVRRKALTLLKLLVLGAGNPISREALADRLWPGVGARTGANRLHGVLHALRMAIEPYREQRRWIFVCNIGDLCYFNMESPHWTDIFAFRRHAASAHDAERRGRREEAIHHLEAALELYRGDLFGDEPYAGWCDLERSELRHRYVDLSARLAGLWVAEREALRGITWLRRGLLADPLREDLHQTLIRTLTAHGHRAEARAQYEVCARLLHDELGVDPLPETRRLADLLQ